jgi:hypothetical protein
MIRNALVETLEQGELLEKMKEKLIGSICPSITKIGNKFEKITK